MALLTTSRMTHSRPLQYVILFSIGGCPYLSESPYFLVPTCPSELPISAAASSEQLTRLASLLTSPHLSSQPVTPHPPNHITLYDILRRSLHNADIWELQRFRGKVDSVFVN